MNDAICLIGLDIPESREIRGRLAAPSIAHENLPGILVRDGRLLVESPSRSRMVPVSRVVFHGIFEDDLDFIAGLALWGGPCYPSAAAMLDCRLKLPCLARALRHTRFGAPHRGYASPGIPFQAEAEHVAKWGNWHCGENKERFRGARVADQPCIIEPFIEGEAVRVVMIGERAWQIRLEGDDWLKSIHHPRAGFMEVDPELLDDTRVLRDAFGLEIIANDYLATAAGTRHLLEVNHIPNVSRFPEIWEAYRDAVVGWIGAGGGGIAGMADPR